MCLAAGAVPSLGRAAVEIEPLEPPAGFEASFARDVNASGDVAGVARGGPGPVQGSVACVWPAAGGVVVLPSAAAGAEAVASSISDVGRVVGHEFAPSPPHLPRAVRWTASGAVDLAGWPGGTASAMGLAIGPGGLVGGVSFSPGVVLGRPMAGGVVGGGSLQQLTARLGAVAAIDGHGGLAGWRMTNDGPRAARWPTSAEGGGAVAAGDGEPLPDLPAWRWSEARAVALGETAESVGAAGRGVWVAGSARDEDRELAVLWAVEPADSAGAGGAGSSEGGLGGSLAGGVGGEALPLIAGATDAWAAGVNGSGTVVGTARLSASVVAADEPAAEGGIPSGRRAWVWHGSIGAVDLNDYLPAHEAARWTLTEAHAVNTGHTVVGLGLYAAGLSEGGAAGWGPGGVAVRAFRLELGSAFPYVPCAADVDANGSVDVFDLLAFIGAFIASAASADVDGSGSVDVFDLLAFIGAFVAC